MRNKLIVIYSVFVFLQIMLLPSYSAFSIRTYNNEINNELIDKEDIVDFRELKDKINIMNGPKYPVLYNIVYSIFTFRMLRGFILFHLSTEVDYSGWQPYYIIIHPLLYERAYFLGVTAELWLEFWYYVSEYFDWGWEF